MSNSGCCSGYSGCGGHSSGYGSGSSGYSFGSGNYNTIDSVISSYSGSSMNTLEMAADYNRNDALPVFEMQSNAEVLNYKKESGGERGKGYNMPYSNSYKIPSSRNADYFSPSTFLKAERPKTQFIGDVDEIKHYINEAFIATTGKELPDDISIEVVSEEELRQRHIACNGWNEQRWSPGIQGFSINRKGFGQSLIAVKENDLDVLMMVIGHEIGHVINFQLSDRLNEEAKAFAFEMAWVKAIYENNIANLRNSINPDPKPARNGLHDVAFNFVKKLLLLGKDAFDIFNGLVKNSFSVEVENAAA